MTHITKAIPFFFAVAVIYRETGKTGRVAQHSLFSLWMKNSQERRGGIPPSLLPRYPPLPLVDSEQNPKMQGIETSDRGGTV